MTERSEGYTAKKHRQKGLGQKRIEKRLVRQGQTQKIDFALFETDWRKGRKSHEDKKQEINLWSETFFPVNKNVTAINRFITQQ